MASSTFFLSVASLSLLIAAPIDGAVLSPQIAGDFLVGRPVLEIAPDERRLSRSTLAGDMFHKAPYSAYPGKRLSLEETVEADMQGGDQLILCTPLSTSALGAFNPRSGTLAVWLRADEKPGPLISGRGAFMRSVAGTALWELGIDADGKLSLQTAAGRCETEEPLPRGWVHLVAVWDSDQGARLYVNGELAGAKGWKRRSRGLSGSPDDQYLGLLLHAGLVVAWYNDDPKIWAMLEGVARGESMRSGEVRSSSEPLLQAVFQKTGKEEYLLPLLDRSQWEATRAVHSDKLYANQYLRLPNLNREATLRGLSLDSAQRFVSHNSKSVGWGDDRHLRNWLEWRLSNSEAPLLDALRALYREWTFLKPVYTALEQSGDRVSPSKQLISQLYLGGVAGARNRHSYPDFAVSDRGLGDHFAARVEESSRRSLRLRLYSFAEPPLTGEVQVWALSPGEFRVRRGEHEETLTLQRGKSFAITLPPQEEWVIQIEAIQAIKEPERLGYPALSEETTRYEEDGNLIVPVYNLGTKELTKLTVRLLDAEGLTVAEQKIASLPGVTNWRLGESKAVFANPPRQAVAAEVSPDLGVPEITENNNRISFLIK